MRTDRQQQLTQAYVETHDRLTQILYEEDPATMGITIGAPPDEYSPEAQLLMADLKETRERAEVRVVLEAHFPSVSDKLVDRVLESWESFTRETNPER